MNRRNEQALNYIGKTVLLFLFPLSLSALPAKPNCFSSGAEHSETIGTDLNYCKAIVRQASLVSRPQLPVYKLIFPFLIEAKGSGTVNPVVNPNFVSLKKVRQTIAPLLFPGFCYFSYRLCHPEA